MRSAAVAAFAILALPLTAGLKILDSAGRPVSGAAVTILLESQNKAGEVFGDEPLVHVTDDRGNLPFDLPRAAGATVVVDHQRYAPVTLLLDGTPPPAFIRLQDGTALSARLIGDGETPPGPGTVCAIRTMVTPQRADTFDVRRCGTIAADGSWTLTALPAGTMRLDIGVPAYLPISKSIALPQETWSATLENGLRALLHVEDAGGRPAAAATVQCDGAVPVTADSRGAAWVAVPHASAACRAFAPDGAESPSQEIVAPSASPQALRLKRARSALLTLATSDGSVPASPRFTLLGRIDDHGQSATRVEPVPNADGALRIRLPSDGPHAIRVEAPGMLPLTTEWFSLPPGGGKADLGVVSLRRGAGIHGRVIHAATQAPLSGAVVSLEAQGRARIVLGRLGKASAVTDSDGSFTVGGVAIGRYSLRVAWPEFPASEIAVDLREETVLTVGAITIHPGVRLTGNVFRRKGLPLAAATVELIPSRLYDTEPVVSATTTAEGRFGPVSVAPGLYRLVVRGDVPVLDQEIEIAPDEESMDVELDIRSTRLTGVLREGGVPVSGGEVLLQRSADLRGSLGVALANNPRLAKQVWSGRPESVFSATVNHAGVFTVHDIPAGRIQLEYFGRSGERVSRAVDVGDDSESSVTVDLDGWPVHGRVDDMETGLALAGTVELVAPDGTSVFRGGTDAAGEFSADRVAAGVYNLVVSAEGYRTGDPLRVVVGNEAPPPVRVRLAKASEATLDLVLERAQDVPAAGVPVAIVDAAGRQLLAYPTMADGKLHATQLPSGTVHLIWSDPLTGVGMSPPIQLRSGPQEVSVRLEPGKDLVVRCEAADCPGTSLGSFTFTSEHGIDLAPFLSRMSAVVYSDRGTAYLGRLAPGKYGVAARSGPFQLTQRLELASGPGEVDLFVTRP